MEHRTPGPSGFRVPVLSCGNEEQLKANLGAVGWSLTREHVEELDAASAQPGISPYRHPAGFSERNPYPVG